MRHYRSELTWFWIASLVLLCACGSEKAVILGKRPAGDPRTIIAARGGDTPSQVAFKGTIIEKCPVAGCWFYLQDETGVIKVDTKSAGFVVVNVPLQSTVTVAGKLVTDGDEVRLEATGLRY